MYWQLTHGSIVHYNPVSLHPGNAGIHHLYRCHRGICCDGSTGLVPCPAEIIGKMKATATHIGPKCRWRTEYSLLLIWSGKRAWILFSLTSAAVSERLNRIHDGFKALKQDGFQVDVLTPEAIYLTIKIDLKGKKTKAGPCLGTRRRSPPTYGQSGAGDRARPLAHQNLSVVTPLAWEPAGWKTYLKCLKNCVALKILLNLYCR